VNHYKTKQTKTQAQKLKYKTTKYMGLWIGCSLFPPSNFSSVNTLMGKFYFQLQINIKTQLAHLNHYRRYSWTSASQRLLSWISCICWNDLEVLSNYFFKYLTWSYFPFQLSLKQQGFTVFKILTIVEGLYQYLPVMKSGYYNFKLFGPHPTPYCYEYI
jgi:hypothetical protein